MSKDTLKTLYILRHAKAAAAPEHDDHARPLMPKGCASAQALGVELARRRFAPDHVLCSTAVRAAETWECLQQGLGRKLAAEHTKKLYLCSPGEMLNLLHALPDRVNSVLLVGHNPGMHQFCLDMTAFGDDDALEELSAHFPTTSLATITVPAAWSDLRFRSGTLVEFLTRDALKENA